jgi:hypothetical protein
MNKPLVKFSNTDGNLFSLMGRCTNALRANGQPELATELISKIIIIVSCFFYFVIY